MRSNKTLWLCGGLAIWMGITEAGCRDSVARVYGGKGAATTTAASGSGGQALSPQLLGGNATAGRGSSVGTSPIASSGTSGALAGAGAIGGSSSAGAAGALSTVSGTGFLHVEGSRLVDESGRSVRLTGVNWFGFETSNLSPHGLWARDYRSMLKQIRDLGFNTVRVPWCDAMLAEGAQVKSLNTYGSDPYDNSINPMNEPLVGKSPLEIMDLIVTAAGELGLRLILDNHSRKPDGYTEEKVWYTDTVTEEQWMGNWVSLARRYRGNQTVIGFDLDNEPHGEASWATGNAATDWNAAAERCGNAILEANPDALIIVEGVEKVGTDVYWWGGNLSGARNHPIVLSRPEKLVYSAHEYGPDVTEQPWFSASDFPENLPSVWNDHFGFIMKEELGHVLIGDFRFKDPNAAGDRSDAWLKAFLAYTGHGYSWTYWSWNPNAGDTVGILEDDWLTPKKWKLDALASSLAPQFK